MTPTSALGTAAYLEIFTGAPAGKTAGTFNADPGTKLASLPLSNPVAPELGRRDDVLRDHSGTALASGTPAMPASRRRRAGGPATVIIEIDAASAAGR